jgi:hypothetical protein
VAHARKRPPLDSNEPTLIDAVERAVRSAGAVLLTKLTREKLTPDARDELLRSVEARGLERTAKAMRVPVEQQILALVQGGARVARKDVPKRVKGATAAEITAAIDKLVRAGRARVVVRTQIEVLTGNSERVLGPGDIARLAKLHKELGAALKKVSAKGPPRSILREDVAALVAPIQSAALPEEAPASGIRDIVESEIRRLEDPALKLVRIPDLVRALAGRLSANDVHRALSDAAASGAVELRPEAGSEFLPAEDAILCPPGPRGTVFSYARRIAP